MNNTVINPIRIKYLYITLISLTIGFITSCSKKAFVIDTPKKVNTINFKNIICRNLSEDQNTLSTKQDEIALLFGILKIDINNTIIGSKVFYKQNDTIIINKEYPIETSINLDSLSSYYLFIGLCELDEKIDLKENAIIFKKSIENQPLSETRKIWSNLLMNKEGTNDNLGITVFRVVENMTNITLSGENLTDKYFYEFEVSSH